MESLPVHIAVLTIAEDAATADHSVARAISERAASAGHLIVDEEIVKDSESAIGDQLVRWIAEENIDVVIVAASVESEAASAALAPLIHQTLPGFTDLFRWLTFQEIGASAMLSAAEAAQCQSTFVFVLPAHEAAVRAAMDKLILPQLDVRTKPKNLVSQMPRLKDAAKQFAAANQSQPVSTPVAQPMVPSAPVVPEAEPTVEAVPLAIGAEKTAGGSGLPPKLPARSKSLTANTIARKQDDPPTKEIDLAKLEKQIRLSTAHDAQTKQVDLKAHTEKTKVVDMSAHQAKTRVVDSGRLPRVPPGAEETSLDEDEALTFRAPSRNTSSTQALPGGVRSPAPIGVVKSRPGQQDASGQTKDGTSPGAPTPMRPPSSSPFATPIARSGASRSATPPSTPASRSATPPATPAGRWTSVQSSTPSRSPATPPSKPFSSRSTAATPPSTPSTPMFTRTPLSSRSTVATPPANPIVLPRWNSSTPEPSAPTSTAGQNAPTRVPSEPTTPEHVPSVRASSSEQTAPEHTPWAAEATAEHATREQVITPSTPVIALRHGKESSANPVVGRQATTEAEPAALPRLPSPAAEPATNPALPRQANSATEQSRPTHQPNAAELWARSIAPGASTSTQSPQREADDDGWADAARAANAAEAEAAGTEDEWIAAARAANAADDESAASTSADESSSDADANVRSPISNLFANQPVRKRPPTLPPAHLVTLGKPLADAELPQGDFVYPLKRGGRSLVLKLLVALAVLGLGFFAFLQLYPQDDKPTQTAAVTPTPAPTPPAPPPTAPAPVAEVVDAAVAPPAQPDIEIEEPAPPPPPAPSHADKPADSKPTTKPAETADVKPDVKPSRTKSSDAKADAKSSSKTDSTAGDTKTTKAEPASGDCDEVSCVISKYDRPCCERYKPTDGFTPRNVVPDTLDRTMVKAGVETIKPKVVACGEQYSAKGTVKLAVTVSDFGVVKSVSVIESPDTALGECVAGAMRRAKFGKSANGAEFNYPFVF